MGWDGFVAAQCAISRKVYLLSTVSSASEEYISDLVAARQPGWTLGREFYTEASIFGADIERVFRRNWLYAGHSSRIPNRGDYFLYEVAGESVILIRAQDGSVRALRNTCRHRGSRVCTAAAGHAPKLICPYHQWVYELDGTLLRARLMPADFDRSGFALRTVQVQIFCGLIFICLDADPPDFVRFVERVGQQLAPQNVDIARVVHQCEYVVQSNWKLVLENSRECYHCGTGHPQYCRAVGFAAGIDSARMAEEDDALARERIEDLQKRGIEARPVPFSEGVWFHARRFFLRGNFETESMDGKPVAPPLAALSGSELGVLAVVTYPNLLLEACADYAIVMRFTPLTTTNTHVSMEWLVAPDAVAGRDFEVSRVEEFWRLTAEQDRRLCEENQKGVNTFSYLPGRYAPQERGVEQFIDWYTTELCNHR